MKNKVITSQGNVQFVFPDGKIVNVHPNHIYTVFNEDTVSFILVALPKSSGLALMTSKAEDLELNGETYAFEDLSDAINEAFSIAGAQARAEIVDELPETGYTNTIYLVPQQAPQTGYDEYIYVRDRGWELIGDTSIEMENYVMKSVFSGYTADTAVVLDGLRTDVDSKTVTVSITQSAYDALPSSAKTDATKLYVISDALPIDLSVYAKVSALTAEESARIAADSALTNAITAEENRAKAAESGLSDTIVAEIARAEEAESGLSNSITAEENRAKAAESGLSESIDAEETRALGAESDLADAISVETSAREAADSAISGVVDTKLATSVFEAYSASTEADINAISGVVDTKLAINDFNAYSGNVDSVLSSKADKANAVASAEYVSSSTTIDLKNISGEVISQVDASDFIIDGFVEDVRIENGYLVIDFNTASGVEDIEIPLTDIFNPENYYDKDDVDAIVSGINEDISAVSGVVDTKLAISDFNTYSGNVATELSGKQNALTPGNGIDITNDVISFNLPISAGDGENSIIIGDGRNISSGIVSVAEGFLTSAMTSYAHSEGSRTLASGGFSTHAEGSRTSATSDASHSEGYQTSASGQYSHSEGWGTTASGQQSHSEGRETSATTAGAHSEGSRTLASGQFSHSEGRETSATSLYSHSEGWGTTASGKFSHSEGSGTTASGEGSHTEGKGTIALNKYEHSEGYFNVSSSSSSTFGDSGNTLFSVGNGTADDARHNAFEIRQNGDIYLTKDGQDVKLQDQLGGGGGGTVSTAITSGDTNAVAGGAVFDAVVYSGSTYTTELTFDANGYAENWVVGQSAITIDVSGYTSDTRADYYFENSNGEDLGRAVISKTIIGTWWTHWDNSSNNCTITTDGDTATTATITDIPSGTVRIRRENESNPPKAIISGDTPEIWIKDALDDHRDNTTVHITAAERSAWNNKSNFSGSYNDLTDKPIPDSALTSYSTNAVQSKTLYDELRINNGGGEAETTLTFEGEYSTNYPEGCTKIKVEVVDSNNFTSIAFYNDVLNLGSVNIDNWGSISVNISGLQDATYEISGTTVIISYPTVTNVTKIQVNGNGNYVYKAVTTGAPTALKNQVAANTTALGGLSLVKLSQQEYDALAPNYDNNTLYVII